MSADVDEGTVTGHVFDYSYHVGRHEWCITCMYSAGVWAALRRSILYANRFTSLQCIMARCLADWVTRAGPPLFVQSSLRFTPLVLAMMRSEFINSGLPLYETENELVLFFIPNLLQGRVFLVFEVGDEGVTNPFEYLPLLKR